MTLLNNETDNPISSATDGDAAEAGDDGSHSSVAGVASSASHAVLFVSGRASDAEGAVVEPAAATMKADAIPASEAPVVPPVVEMPAEEFTAHAGVGFEYGACRVSAASARRMASLREQIGDEPLTGIENRWLYRFAKRAFDVVFSAAVLVCFCWLYAIIAILVKIDDPKGPVFFSQERVGKGGKPFHMHKFRSMVVDAEERLDELQSLNEKTGPVFKIKDDPRVTRVGHWLRKLSLDELPQFWDVLKGDIPLRILKTRPEFSEKSMGAFALPAKSSTNKGKAFSQVVSCFANGLRMRRISKFNCNRIRGMEAQFLAKPVFGAVCA